MTSPVTHPSPLHVSSGLPGRGRHGDPSEREAGGGRADPQPGPLLPATALPAQPGPAAGAGGAGGPVVGLTRTCTPLTDSTLSADDGSFECVSCFAAV